VGKEPEGAAIEEQGFGWTSSYKSGKGKDAITSGLEVTWTTEPARWTHSYFQILFGYEWELTTSPAGAKQWVAKTEDKIIPDAFDPNVKHKPTMLTTDLALRFDPIYGPISKKFMEDPKAFEEAFAKAWFKLTHRDMGPITRYVGPEAPKEALIWQDPIPVLNHAVIDVADISNLKAQILKSGLTVSELVETAWASASTYRDSDRRGGANGARIALEPQRSWAVNNPAQLTKVLAVYAQIQRVLGGAAALEQAAKNAGVNVVVPFTPGRMDATQAQTDVNSFAVLEPMADAFRNYKKAQYTFTTEELMVDKAQLLGLTAPEMTVLIGGMRVLGTNFDDSNKGVFTKSVGTLNNDFFINLLDMSIVWKPVDANQELFEGRDRKTGAVVYTATRADLIYGSNSELRAIAEVYGSSDAKEKFIKDFISAWDKVMMADRFDIK
jgi:catalase-peroxidase